MMLPIRSNLLPVHMHLTTRSSSDDFDSSFDSAVKQQNALSTAAIVGISIGAFISLCGTIAFIWIVVRQSNRKRQVVSTMGREPIRIIERTEPPQYKPYGPDTVSQYDNAPEVAHTYSEQGSQRKESSQQSSEFAPYRGGEVNAQQYELQAAPKPTELPR